ncbi:DBH-like monooxygenase protein 1 isoform X2 [Homarus americanus]|nr:DBH-like monooxygenase protein 1 isoform X2 [Homarus americanus]XP_042233946.1 DBH-like monooxygenase protein 1 isoform X2 [Homarus americanus]
MAGVAGQRVCCALLALLGMVNVPGAAGQPSVSLAPFEFHHRAVMDQRGAYIMLWTPLQDKIVIEVQVATRGYVGLGFSPNGGMKGADVVIGWVDAQGQLQFQDRYAFALLTPSIDESQDYLLLGGYENDSHTVMRFSRPWITCDTHHDFQLSGDTVRVLWSYDEEDPTTSDRLARHDHWGSRSLYLRDPHLAARLPPPAHLQFWDVLSPQVRLPDGLPTLYWCKLYKIPNLTTKTHIIGYIPLIEQQNLQHVHHMLLYECHLPNSDRYLEMFVEAKGAQCYDQNMPLSWSACNTPIVAWGIGSEGEMYPEHVGVPLGEEHGGATYFMLEIHYDNPNLRTGVVDSSGVRILYTQKLRQYDAGILTLGHTVSPTHIIPPAQNWNTVAHCTAACTEKTLPDTGIKVFQGFLHAHLLGSSISIQQIRNGYELPTVIKDMNYDFNYQQARVLKKEMEILPGDSLIVNCGYNSTRRKMPTFGGFSTEEEMCLAFLTYYPRVNLSGCYSKPDMALVFDTFGIQDLVNNDLKMFNHQGFSEYYINEEDEKAVLLDMLSEGGTKPHNIHLADIYHNVVAKAPQKYFNVSFYDILYDKTTWQNNQLITTLQEMTMFGQHEPSCENHGRELIQGLPKKVRYPDFIPLKPQHQKCTSNLQDAEVHKPETKSSVPPPTNQSSGEERKRGKTPATTAAMIPWHPPKDNEIQRASLPQRDKGGVGQVTSSLYVISTLTFFMIVL